MRNQFGRLTFCCLLLAAAPLAVQDAGIARQEQAITAAVGLRQPALLLGSERFALAAAAKLDLGAWIIEDRTPVANWQQNSAEATAYVYVLVKAHRSSLESLTQAARRDLTRIHLFEESEKYRGEIVHANGQMLRVRRFDPPALAVNEGVRDLYEGWLFDEASYGAHPICVVFTTLPDGLTVGERMRVPAQFDGYFFKRYRYQAAKGWREAPLLIGRQPIVMKPQAPDEEEMSQGTMLVMLFLGLLAGTLCLALGLAFWYHCGDRQIRSRLDAARMRQFVEPQ